MEIIVAIGLLFFFIWAYNLPKPGSSSGSSSGAQDDEVTREEPSRGGHGGQMGCLICGNSASAQCSQCQSFVCANHTNRVKLQSGQSVIWCSDCYEEDRQSTQAEIQSRVYKCAACKKKFIDDYILDWELRRKISDISSLPFRQKARNADARCRKGCIVCGQCEGRVVATPGPTRTNYDQCFDYEVTCRCKACGHIWSIQKSSPANR